MIIVYTPQGGEREEYDAGTLRVSEASIVSRTVDMKWAEVQAGLGSEDLDAMRGIVWVLKKRARPTLRFSEFDPGINEMVTRLDRTEVRSWVEEAVATAARNPEVTPEDVATALEELPGAALDPDYARQVIAELTAAPKAPEQPGPPEQPEAAQDPSPSPTSSAPETATSDSSPTSSTSLPQPSMT